MLARVHSGALIGIDAHPVEVEIDVYPGLPSIAVVGLPDSAVKESAAGEFRGRYTKFDHPREN